MIRIADRLEQDPRLFIEILTGNGYDVVIIDGYIYAIQSFDVASEHIPKHILVGRDITDIYRQHTVSQRDQMSDAAFITKLLTDIGRIKYRKYEYHRDIQYVLYGSEVR